MHGFYDNLFCRTRFGFYGTSFISGVTLMVICFH